MSERTVEDAMAHADECLATLADGDISGTAWTRQTDWWALFLLADEVTRLRTELEGIMLISINRGLQK